MGFWCLGGVRTIEHPNDARTPYGKDADKAFGNQRAGWLGKQGFQHSARAARHTCESVLSWLRRPICPA
jgi:hypothetical protein